MLLSCASHAVYTILSILCVSSVCVNQAFYILQASLSLRLIYVYSKMLKTSESAGMQHAERHPVRGVVLMKITLEGEYRKC
jgi:hypothetical protein